MTDAQFAALTAQMASALREPSQLSSLPLASIGEIRSRVAQGFDFGSPCELSELTSLTAGLLRDGTVHTPSPTYFGLFNPAVTDASVAGDSLVAAFNPQLAAYSHSPAAQEIERHTLRALSDRMGLASGSVGHFTSGGSEANHTATLLALTRTFPGYAEEGAVEGARLYVSAIAHDSFGKIAHACGIGRRALRKVPVDGSLRMDMAALANLVAEDLAAGKRPFMVVGTAGTTSTGAIDPLNEIADFAETHRLWFHADAAWGGGALLSPRRRSLMAGIERADSVTCDAHKWLSVPMGAGMLFTRHPSLLSETFRVDAAYMPARTEFGIDPFLSTMQWSRRCIGLKVAMSLANLGWAGYEETIERMFALGDELRERLASAGWIIKNPTDLPLVCFSHPRIESGEVTLEAVLAAIYRDNAVWVSIAPLGPGERALRACITSIHTRSEHLETLVSVCERALYP